jgi:hypothetical protein
MLFEVHDQRDEDGKIFHDGMNQSGEILSDDMGGRSIMIWADHESSDQRN